jgi:hypothetical protein
VKRCGAQGGDELRAIKQYLATRKDKLPWVFVSERQQSLRDAADAKICFERILRKSSANQNCEHYG